MGSAAAVLGFWGIFSRNQTANSNTTGVHYQHKVSGVPTLVPQIQSSVTNNSTAIISQAQRAAPITITRSSR
jgi:hypothetical protein